jgi:hypothetical protein
MGSEDGHIFISAWRLGARPAFKRASGTRTVLALPGDKSPGYYQKSLRGKYRFHPKCALS